MIVEGGGPLLDNASFGLLAIERTFLERYELPCLYKASFAEAWLFSLNICWPAHYKLSMVSGASSILKHNEFIHNRNNIQN